jgi:hypothetical protein
MLIIPKTRSIRSVQTETGRVSDTWGIDVASGGSAHTLSASFVELVASTAFDTWLVEVSFQTGGTVSATNTSGLCTIYVGAGGSEEVLIPTLLCGWSAIYSNFFHPRKYIFPLFIPAGSRISAKTQCVTASRSFQVQLKLQGGGEPPIWCGSRVECVGADTANSRGTSVTPGTTSEGTFTSIGTNTHEWRYILPMVQGNVADTTQVNGTKSLDIGIGGAVYKELEDFIFQFNNIEVSSPFNPFGQFTMIPASSSLQARLQDASTDAEAKDVCLYGVY